MRDIKFRGWDAANKGMLVPLDGIMGDRVLVLTDLYMHGFFHFNMPNNYDFIFDGEVMVVRDCEIMQYTGIKDKNGKEIYEGDIVQVNETSYPTKIFEVYWNEDRWGLKHGEIFFEIEDNSLGDVIDWYEAEIIGNIYETPGLITESKS